MNSSMSGLASGSHRANCCIVRSCLACSLQCVVGVCHAFLIVCDDCGSMLVCSLGTPACPFGLASGSRLANFWMAAADEIKKRHMSGSMLQRSADVACWLHLFSHVTVCQHLYAAIEITRENIFQFQ